MMEDWSKQTWISRCTIRYMERLHITRDLARSFALESEPSREWGPEEAADEDLSYWTD